jgi:hypothetical protein
MCGCETREQNKKTMATIVRVTVLLAVLVVLVVLQEEVGSALKATRGEVKELPLGTVIPVFLLISAVRRLVPPAYYCVPVGTLFTMYCCDKLGEYKGALVYQCVKLQEILYFFLIKMLFSDISAKVFEGEEELWWLSPTLRKGLRYIDEAWRERTNDQPVYVQGPIVVTFGLAMYMEDYITLFWLATRSGITFPVYCAVWPVSLAAEYMKIVLKMRAYSILLDAYSGPDEGKKGTSVFDIAHMPWYEVLLATVFVTAATLYVHGTNFYLAFRGLRAWFEGNGCCGGPQEQVAAEGSAGGVSSATSSGNLPASALLPLFLSG